jgi:hypothetical protein
MRIAQTVGKWVKIPLDWKIAEAMAFWSANPALGILRGVGNS